MINSVTGTKDLQHVNISLRVLSRPVEQKLPEIFSKIGIDFDERVLPGVGNEVLKAVVAQYNAEELLSKREQISDQIRTNLMQRAREFHLILDGALYLHVCCNPPMGRTNSPIDRFAPIPFTIQQTCPSRT